jgi:hypothetical protein
LGEDPLKQGVAAWNAWRDRYRDRRPDLSSANLHETRGPTPTVFGNAPIQWLAELLLKEGKYLCQDSLTGYYYPPTCASAASACGSQKVISIAWYISMAVANVVRACSG